MNELIEGISHATRKERNMELNELGLSEEQLANVQKLVQGAEDRVRTDYSKKLKDANDELSKYKPVEKSEAEKDLETRLKALEDKEKEIANKEKSLTVTSKLKEKGLPEELASYLAIGEDVDKTIESVGTTLGNYFLNNGNKPANHSKNQAVTREQFKKMGYGERAKLASENPTLYQALNK